MRLHRGNSGKKKLCLLQSLLLLVSLSGFSAAAGDITFEEAVVIGLSQNSRLQELERSLQSLQRSQDLIKAGADWQLSLTGSCSHIIGGEEKSSLLPEGGSSSGADLTISASRSLLSGLTIKPEVAVTGDNLSPEFSLDISQHLYPAVPTEEARRLYKGEKELLRASENFIQEKAARILAWIQDYLNLVRLAGREVLYRQEVELARGELGIALKNQEIGEASAGDVLAARINLEGALYNLEELEQQIEEARLSHYQELGLEEGQGVLISADSHFLKKISEEVDKILKTAQKRGKAGENGSLSSRESFKESSSEEEAEPKLELEDFLTMLEENSYQLSANLIEQEMLKEELKWEQAGRAPRVTAGGSYGSERDEFRLSLNLSYQLFDGGQQELNLEEREKALNEKAAAYDDLYNSLKLQLTGLINKVELSRSAGEQERLRLEKAVYEEKIGREQLEMGLIGEKDYRKLRLRRKEAELNLNNLQNQLFVNKIQLAVFVSPIAFLEGVL